MAQSSWGALPLLATNYPFSKSEVLNSPDLAKAIETSAAETGKPIAKVRADVDSWLDEIVPAFNTWAFYRFGFNIARLALNFAFEVIIDRRALERVPKKIPDEAAE